MEPTGPPPPKKNEGNENLKNNIETKLKKKESSIHLKEASISNLENKLKNGISRTGRSRARNILQKEKQKEKIIKKSPSSKRNKSTKDFAKDSIINDSNLNKKITRGSQHQGHDEIIVFDKRTTPMKRKRFENSNEKSIKTAKQNINEFEPSTTKKVKKNSK